MRHKVGQSGSEAEALFAKAEKCEENGLQKEAFEYLLKAGNLGHTGAQVTLGNNYSWGKGVKKSDEKAAYWYKRAYRNGDEAGAFNLAIDKLKGKNTRSAIFWFERSRAMGSGEAALELSKIYLGRRRGKPKAIHLLQLTQKMKRAEISDETKQEANRLLSTLVETRQ
jgi:TPR repeat protein